MLPRYVFSFLVFFTLVVYGVFLARHVGAYAGGADSSGYMNNARLLERAQLLIKRREIPGLSTERLPAYAYIPLGFVPVGAHEMAPTYAMGLPLLILGASYLVGWDQAATVTIWLHAMLSLLILYCLSRAMGLSHPLAYLGTVVLGLSSIFMFMALQAMSDVPALAWCSFVILASWLARRNTHWAVVAGFAFSVSVLIRPTNLLMIVPVAVAFGLGWKNWVRFAVGGIPGAIFQAALNIQLYGKLLTTGYGSVGSLFRLEYVLPGALAYLQLLPVMLTPAVILIVAIPYFLHRQADRRLIMLAAWAGVFLGFYAFYFHTHESWTYIRFLLPAFSAIIILMLMAMDSIFSSFSARLRWTAGVLFSVMAVGWNALWLEHFGFLPTPGEKVYPAAATWANEHLPGNSVILTMQTSGALFFYTPFTLLRCDQFTLDTFAGIERASIDAGRPIYAILFPFETEDVLKARLPGRWTQISAIEHVTIWQRMLP